MAITSGKGPDFHKQNYNLIGGYNVDSQGRLGMAGRSANRRADAPTPRSMGDVRTRLSLRWRWLRRGPAALLLRREVGRRRGPW